MSADQHGAILTLTLTCAVPLAAGTRVSLHAIRRPPGDWIVLEDTGRGIWFANLAEGPLNDAGNLHLVGLHRRKASAGEFLDYLSKAGVDDCQGVQVWKADVVSSTTVWGHHLGARDPYAHPSTVLILQLTNDSTRDEPASRRKVGERNSVLYWTGQGLEQDWPNGATHRVVWSEPFSAVLHRDPRTVPDLPSLDIHARLRQTSGGQAHTIALTLALTANASLATLPALEQLLPRLEGSEAERLMQMIQWYARIHGAPLPVS